MLSVQRSMGGCDMRYMSHLVQGPSGPLDTDHPRHVLTVVRTRVPLACVGTLDVHAL